MKKFFLILICVFIFPLMHTDTFSDIIWTRSFNYKGTILEENSEFVILQTGNKKRKILKRDIEDITYSGTSESNQHIKSSESVASQNIIGKWFADGSGGLYFSGPITIFKKGGKIFLKWEFDDGSVHLEEVESKFTSAGRRFDYKGEDGTGDYYVINNSGDLEIRDAMGIIQIAKKIRDN